MYGRHRLESLTTDAAHCVGPEGFMLASVIASIDVAAFVLVRSTYQTHIIASDATCGLDGMEVMLIHARRAPALRAKVPAGHAPS
jgi:hypothetical protein